MGLLETLKSCYTCVGRGVLYCDHYNKCVIHGDTHKSLWVICVRCNTCIYKHTSASDYLNICNPCFSNNFASWSHGNESLKPHFANRYSIGETNTEFKVPY